MRVGQSPCTIAYDASGDMVADSRSGALGVVFGYDPEGRLERVKLPNGATTALYRYDPLDHLTSRQLAATGTTTLYFHDTADHIIAETDAAGVTKREYIWVNDLPVAVADEANTASPSVYYVHTDHLGHPVRMMAQNGAAVWDVTYAPFGGVITIMDATVKLDMRFPGQ